MDHDGAGATVTASNAGGEVMVPRSSAAATAAELHWVAAATQTSLSKAAAKVHARAAGPTVIGSTPYATGISAQRATL